MLAFIRELAPHRQGPPSLELLGVGSQQWASDAGVFVDAGGGVGAAAGSELDFAFLEVSEEPIPFGVGDVAVLGAGSLLTAAGDEGTVVFDDVVVVDGDVALGGVEVVVPEDFGGDVDGESGGDGGGGEDPPEIVRCEPCGCAVVVGDGTSSDDPGHERPGVGLGDHGVDETVSPLEQER